MKSFPYQAVLDELELEYAEMSGDSNPPKQSIPLAEVEHDGSLRRYVNVMGAKLSDGTFGSKTVFVDELDNKTGGLVTHFGADGSLLYTLPASLVTPLRCAMMAALCLSMRRLGEKRDVTIVGRGELGLAIANTLWILRKELEIQGIISVAGRHIYRNQRRLLPGIQTDFWVLKDFKDSWGDWNSKPTSTLITATNNDGSDLLHPGPGSPAEVVSFDGGGLLSPAWRHSHTNYCDYPHQLRQHLNTEFPYDGPAGFLGHIMPLNELRRSKRDDATAAYLYGIAMADLVVGRALSRHLDMLEDAPASYDHLIYREAA